MTKLSIEVLENLTVGSLIEVPGLFGGMTEEPLVLQLLGKKTSEKGGVNYEFELSYFNVYLGTKLLFLTSTKPGGKLIWVD